MEEEHRQIISNNIGYLKNNTRSFDALFDNLKAKGMFNDYMEREIKQIQPDKISYFYWYVTTRGPKAFSMMITALNETGNNHLVWKLTEGPKMVIPGNSSNQMTLEEEFPDDKEWTVNRTYFSLDLNREEVFNVLFLNEWHKVANFSTAVMKLRWQILYPNVEAYKMDSSPRGLALIINNKLFINDVQDPRKGSDKDVERLTNILEQLDYKVIVHENQKAEEMKEIVANFARMKEHIKYDSSIVIVMSHSNNDKSLPKIIHTINIAGTDHPKYINSEEIVEKLEARNCIALRGKPKIFFFVVCRGGERNYPVSLINDESFDDLKDKSIQNGQEIIINGQEILSIKISDKIEKKNSSIQTDGNLEKGWLPSVRSDSDIFIAYPTSDGYVSYRDEEHGSWFVQLLCRVLAKHACDMDLVSIMQKVSQKGESLGFTVFKSNRGFNRKLFFQPSISRPSLESLSQTNGS